MSRSLDVFHSLEVVQRQALAFVCFLVPVPARTANPRGSLPDRPVTFPVTNLDLNLTDSTSPAGHRVQLIRESIQQLLLQLVYAVRRLTDAAPFAPSIERLKDVVKKAHRLYFINRIAKRTYSDRNSEPTLGGLLYAMEVAATAERGRVGEPTEKEAA